MLPAWMAAPASCRSCGVFSAPAAALLLRLLVPWSNNDLEEFQMYSSTWLLHWSCCHHGSAQRKREAAYTFFFLLLQPYSRPCTIHPEEAPPLVRGKLDAQQHSPGMRPARIVTRSLTLHCCSHFIDNEYLINIKPVTSLLTSWTLPLWHFSFCLTKFKLIYLFH